MYISEGNQPAEIYADGKRCCCGKAGEMAVRQGCSDPFGEADGGRENHGIGDQDTPAVGRSPSVGLCVRHLR